MPICTRLAACRVGLQRLYGPQILFFSEFHHITGAAFLVPARTEPLTKVRKGCAARRSLPRAVGHPHTYIRKKRKKRGRMHTLHAAAAHLPSRSPHTHAALSNPKPKRTGLRPTPPPLSADGYKKSDRPSPFGNERPSCWGIRTRTRKNRTRICCVANYTIPQAVFACNSTLAVCECKGSAFHYTCKASALFFQENAKKIAEKDFPPPFPPVFPTLSPPKAR